jgi:fermentation-respiration switch protein FrsA (DUF1100 family)
LPSANLLTFLPGCQKDFALAQYGERFAQAGFASFIFDYRTFGGSEGLPRHWASPARHLDDYMSAVQYVKEQLGGEVDVSKLNLWGSSFSGGHVLTLAGSKLRDEVTAVIAQVRHSVKTSLHGRGGYWLRLFIALTHFVPVFASSLGCVERVLHRGGEHLQLLM